MLLLLLVVVAMTTTSATMYQLADIMYSVPTCEVGSAGTILQNSFGQLYLKNSLVGSRLYLTVAPDASQTSCRFCDRLGYCTQSLGNESALHLAYDTRYNIRVVSVDQPGAYVSLSIAVPPSNNTTPTSESLAQSVTIEGAQLGLPQLCGQKRRLVVMLFMTTEAPVVRDFLVTAWDPSSWDSIPCSAAPTGADLACTVAPAYYVLDYEVTNCADWVAPTPLAVPTTTNPGPTYVNYYYEAVAMHADGALPQLRICGESWLSLYTRCRLETYCDADNVLFIGMKPWYQAVLYATAAWQNGRRDEAVWQALQELEQYCEARDMVLDLFVNMSLSLAPSDTATLQSDWAVLCDWASQNNESLVHTNITLPFYFYHHTDWYFDTFKHVIYYNDPQMPLKSALLVAFASLAALFITGAFAWTVWYVWKTVRLRRESHEYLLV